METANPRPQTRPDEASPRQAPLGRRARPLGSAVVIVDHEPLQQTSWSERRLALQKVFYSIRIPRRPGERECFRCGAVFRAAGPTGHADDEPICDLCLLECEEELGMVLALVSVVRAYAASDYASPEEHWDSLEEVGAFARIYERVASARSGPGRIFRPDLSRPKL